MMFIKMSLLKWRSSKFTFWLLFGYFLVPLIWRVFCLFLIFLFIIVHFVSLFPFSTSKIVGKSQSFLLSLGVLEEEIGKKWVSVTMRGLRWTMHGAQHWILGTPSPIPLYAHVWFIAFKHLSIKSYQN